MRNGLTLFGTPLRSRILMLVATLEESYAAELARALRANDDTVADIVRRLEEEDILVGMPSGRQRRVRLNPRYPEARRIGELLILLLDADEEARLAASSLRRRPRARNKPL